MKQNRKRTKIRIRLKKWSVETKSIGTKERRR